MSAISTTFAGTTQIVVAAVTYRPFGGIESFVFGNGQPYVRSFDLDGRITGYTLADRTQLLTWDAADRITALADSASPSTPTVLGYDSLDRLTGFVTPSSSQSLSYDAVGNRLTQSIGANTYTYGYGSTSNRLLTVSGPTPRSYAYDAAGDSATNGKHIFVHDVRGRLTQVISAGNGALLAQYQINALGQRVQKLPGSGAGRVFLYDLAGHLIAEATPDGRALWDHVWLGEIPVAWVSVDQDEDGVPDQRDNCIEVANPNQHDVEGDGIGEVCDGDVNGDGVVDSSDPLIIQYCGARLLPCLPKYDVDGSGRVTSYDAYLSARRRGLPPGPSGLKGEAAAASVFYVYPDHLGTPRVITDNRNRVRWRWDNADPFGANVANEDPDVDYMSLSYPLRFPGQYFDKETGLHYNYFRDYDPQTGRYVQPDPIGLQGGINTYGYVGSNPLLFADAYGLQAQPLPDLTPSPSLPPPANDPIFGNPGASRIPWFLNPIAVGVVLMCVPGNIGQGDAACSDDPVGKRPECGGNDPCRGLREQLAAHEKKLQEYMANPQAHDNKGILGQGRDAQIIAGRIRSLQKQIENFRKLLEECERKHGKRD